MFLAKEAKENARSFFENNSSTLYERNKNLIDGIYDLIRKTSSLGYTSTLIKIDKTDLSDKDMDAFEQLLMKQGYGVEHQSGYAFTWAFLIRWY
jgi:hypothetical protein